MNVGQNDVWKIPGIIQPKPHGICEVIVPRHDFVAGLAEEDDSRFAEKAGGKLFNNRLRYDRARPREHEPCLAIWEGHLHSVGSRSEHCSPAQEVDPVQRCGGEMACLPFRNHAQWIARPSASFWRSSEKSWARAYLGLAEVVGNPG